MTNQFLHAFININNCNPYRLTYQYIELGDIPQKNQKEGIFVIPVSISSKTFIPANRHTVRMPVYCKNTDIP